MAGRRRAASPWRCPTGARPTGGSTSGNRARGDGLALGPAVVAFLARAAPAFISAVSLHELWFGVERLAAGRRREELRRWLVELDTLYAEVILPVGAAEADEAARLRAGAARRGRTVHLADGLIAGTAVRHGLMLATRDAGDFAELPVAVVDPGRRDGLSAR